MRIRLVKVETIEGFSRKNAQSSVSFELWLGVLHRAYWNTPGDILNTFPTADMLGNGSNRVVFNIGGNKYRMICHYVFGETQVHLFVNWIGTHAEYTKLCKWKKQYTISFY